MENNKVTLRYWDIRGLGQVSRLLLAYTETNWEDKPYKTAEGNKWFEEDKPKQGSPFANLPHIIDGDYVLNESSAVAEYIIKRANRADMLGKDLKEEGRVREVLGVINDTLIKGCLALFFNKNWEADKPNVQKDILPKLKAINQAIGDKDTFFGHLTLCDFYLAEYSNFAVKLFPEELAKLEGIKRVRDNIEGLPQVQKYYAQPGAIKDKFLPASASIPF